MQFPDMSEQERLDAIKHQNALTNIRQILSTVDGRAFFKYLLVELQVGEFPPMGLEGVVLHDHLGFLRAGNSIFALAAEASPITAGQLLAEKEKERNAKLYAQNQEDAIDGRGE